VVTRCDVLAVGAHPDDVELGCGGSLARLAGSGLNVGIVDLSAGELGTRGDAELRSQEAATAARHLGAAWRVCVGLADGGIDGADERQRGELVAVLRQAAPRVVLAPDPGDPHPDHAAGAALVRWAAFFAGVARYHPELGAPGRPRLILGYPGPRQLLVPTLVVDVSGTYAAKRAALAAHASQFEPAAGAPTHLASGFFLAAVEGRDRACGNLIGSEFGEGFAAQGALPGDEIAWLLGERR
jgi:bacillithiol biosynthesis deacetylase BshB1